MELIDEIKDDADVRMGKSLEALHDAFARIRTGRAHPSLLNSVRVPYYGADTPIQQVATITVEEGRTLLISPWEKKDAPGDREGHPAQRPGPDAGCVGRRRPAAAAAPVRGEPPGPHRQARHEAEHTRVAMRNIRRDAIHDVREFLKEKEITEDDAFKAEGEIQKITDGHIQEVDEALQRKEADLLEI